MLHKLTEWEDNGYDDSDFYISVWDDEAGAVRQIEVGSTRYAGGGAPVDARPVADPVVLDAALRWLAGAIFGQLRSAEDRDVLEPQDAPIGTILRTVRLVRPRNAAPVPVGTVGEVFWCGAFGQFYAKGYNRPCRENRRVGLRLADGSSVYVALNACRLDVEPLSDADLMSRSWDLAQNCGFSHAVGCKAWDSKNYAADLYQRVHAADIAREIAESWARVA